MLSDCDQRAAIKHIRANDWLHLIRVGIDIDSITLYNCAGLNLTGLASAIAGDDDDDDKHMANFIDINLWLTYNDA